MMPILYLEHIIHAIRMILDGSGFTQHCHIVRNHFINPRPHQKWVTVAHLKCVFKAPASWYRSP